MDPCKAGTAISGFVFLPKLVCAIIEPSLPRSQLLTSGLKSKGNLKLTLKKAQTTALVINAQGYEGGEIIAMRPRVLCQLLSVSLV